MSASNVMTRARTAALALEEATALRIWEDNAELRVVEAHVTLRVEDPLAAQRIEEERGLGSWYELQLEMARRPVLQILEREDAAQLLVYEADGPSTRGAEEQAVFHRVVWDVAMEFGFEDDVARYLYERDLRLTLLDAFQAVDQRLEDKKL
jgi:hypothetical protein